MAELKTKKGKIVNCNVLNESTYSYLIEYNGRVGQVRKDRIVSLNKVDEAVLEGLGDRVKGLFKKIKERLAKFFLGKEKVASGTKTYNPSSRDDEDYGNETDEVRTPIYQVHTSDPETGKVMQVTIPVQAAIASAQGLNRTFIAYDGPKSDYDFAKKMGIPINNVPKDAEDKELNDFISSKREEIHESMSEKAPRRSVLNEADARKIAAGYKYVGLKMAGNKDLKSSDDVVTQNEQFGPTKTLQEAAEEIYLSYRKQRMGRNSQSICLWGAPGIGKSNIKKIVMERIQEHYPDVRWIEISGRGNSDDLYMQVKHTIQFHTRKGEKRDMASIALVNISNLPMYNSNNLTKEEILDYEFYANGGRWKDNGELDTRDDGGIIFIDEFSRSREAMMSVLMSLISDQNIGGGIKLGNKWMVMMAANTKSQMRGLDAAEDFFLDPAQQSRCKNIVIEPDKTEWAKTFGSLYKQYTSEVDGKTYTFSAIEPEIIDFATKYEDGKWFYNLQIIPPDAEEFTNQYASKAIPRTWENASQDLRAAMIIFNEDNGTDIQTVTDFWNFKDARGRKIGEEIIRDQLSMAVGVPAAEAFAEYMKSATFGRKEAQDVWTKGTCTVTTFKGDSFVPDIVVPKLVMYNPGFEDIPNSNRATVTDLINIDQLMNVAQYMADIISNSARTAGTGAKTTSFSTCYAKFQQMIIKRLQSFKEASNELAPFLTDVTINPTDRDLNHFLESYAIQLSQTGDPNDTAIAKKIVEYGKLYNELTKLG